MPKHRRRKNQRRLDSKSIRNSQVKSRQKQHDDDPDPDYDDEIDEDQDEDQQGAARRRADRQESDEEEAEDLVGSRSAESVTSPTTAELPGPEPTQAQTPPIPDVAEDDRRQQHQPTSSAPAPAAISESAIDDRSSSGESFSTICVTEEFSKTGSNQSSESAVEPPSKDASGEITSGPANLEVQQLALPEVHQNETFAGVAPPDEIQIAAEDTRSRSQSFSESSDACVRKDECGTGTCTTDGTVSPPRSSPDREISNNQNATICDTTTTTEPAVTTTTTTSTTKALAETSKLPICDNVSKATADDRNDLGLKDKPANNEVEHEVVSLPKLANQCNNEVLSLDGYPETKDENRLSLTEAASMLSEKISLLCSEIQMGSKRPAQCDIKDLQRTTTSTLSDKTSITENLLAHNEKLESVSSANISELDQIEPPVDQLRAKSKSPHKHLTLLIETAPKSPKFDIESCSPTDSAEEQANIQNDHRKSEQIQTPSTPKRLPIVQEVITTLYPTRVESPKPMRPTRRKAGPLSKSKSLDDDDIMIQEMSDTSSTGDLTDNQPLVSEASESEADTDTAPMEFEEKLDPRILSVQTLPFDSSDEAGGQKNDQKPLPTMSEAQAKEEDESNRGDTQDVKARRAKNRAALEMHFFPQFLNPRFLDSIKEENSDTSDLEGRSPTRHRSSSSLGDIEDDVFASSTLAERRSSAPSTPKADAVFPKSSLDFSQKHKHLSNLRSPQTGVIREESPCFVVEAKLVDAPVAVEESCSEWTTKLVAASADAAEVVYIDSASSSSSDLNELDYTDSTVPSDTNEEDSSDTVHIETPTIEATEDANNIFGDPEKTPTREIPSLVEIEHRRQETALLEENRFNDLINGHTSSEDLSKPIHPQLPDYLDQGENSNPTQVVASCRVPLETPALKDSPHSGESFSAIRDEVTSNQTASESRFSCNIEAGQSAVESEPPVLENINKGPKSEQKSSKSKPDFKIGGPCSINMFASLYTHLLNNNSDGVPPNPVPANDDVNKPVVDENVNNNERGEFVRQDSAGSHCSNQSQNTVINRGPPSQTDLTDLDNGPCVSESPNGFSGSEQIGHPESLRHLCLDTLAGMPHGVEVLEELASVSEAISIQIDKYQQQQELHLKNLIEIGSMPYPKPVLPKIHDLIVPQRPPPPSSQVKFVTASPTKLRSPSPPPVPDRPAATDSWLGVPTDRDPNIIVCLSPSQRDHINNGSGNYKSRQVPTPDALLDMHRKFITRRGYHELPSATVYEIDRKKLSTEKLDRVTSSPQLRRSASPPPIPPPPSTDRLAEREVEQSTVNAKILPQQSKQTPLTTSAASDGDGVTTDDPRDENSRRLLAIIRDSKQAFCSDKQSVQEKVEQQRIINNPQQPPGSQHPTENSDTNKLDRIQGQPTVSVERQPPLVPPRSFASGPQVQGTSSSNSTPQSVPTSDMSSSTAASFDNTYWSDPFNFGSFDPRKRFSNLENSSPFGSQLMTAQPKRFSSVETLTTTSKKRIENGKVVYDVSDTSKEKSTSGDEESAKTIFSDGRGIREKFTSDLKAKLNGGFASTSSPIHQQTTSVGHNTDQQIHHQQESRQTQHGTTSTFSQTFENRSKAAGDETPLSHDKKQEHFAYDEFRQRAKESAAEKAKSDFLERQNYLLKDFDELTKLINEDLFKSESARTASNFISSMTSESKSTSSSAGVASGTSTGMPASKSTGTSAGKSAGTSAGTPAGMPAGTPAGMPAGTQAGMSAGMPPGILTGTSARASAGNTAPYPGSVFAGPSTAYTSTKSSAATSTTDSASDAESSRNDSKLTQNGTQPAIRNVPIQFEESMQTRREHVSTQKHEETREQKVFNVPIKIEKFPVRSQGPQPWPSNQQTQLKTHVSSSQKEFKTTEESSAAFTGESAKNSSNNTQQKSMHIHNVPIKIEESIQTTREEAASQKQEAYQQQRVHNVPITIEKFPVSQEPKSWPSNHQTEIRSHVISSEKNIKNSSGSTMPVTKPGKTDGSTSDESVGSFPNVSQNETEKRDVFIRNASSEIEESVQRRQEHLTAEQHVKRVYNIPINIERFPVRNQGPQSWPSYQQTNIESNVDYSKPEAMSSAKSPVVTSTSCQTDDSASDAESARNVPQASRSEPQQKNVIVHNIPIKVEENVQTRREEHVSTAKHDGSKEQNGFSAPIREEKFPVKGQEQQSGLSFQQTEIKRNEQEATRVRTVPIQIENNRKINEESSRVETVYQASSGTNDTVRERTIPIQIEAQQSAQPPSARSPEVTFGKRGYVNQRSTTENQETVSERTIPIKIEAPYSQTVSSSPSSQTHIWQKSFIDQSSTHRQEEVKERTVPIQFDRKLVLPSSAGSSQPVKVVAQKAMMNQTFVRQKEEVKERTVPIQIERPSNQTTANQTQHESTSTFRNQTSQSTTTDGQRTKERTVPIQIISSQSQQPTNPQNASHNFSPSPSRMNERRLSSQDPEFKRYVEDLGASSENITRPLMKEVEICAFGRRSNVRAPRIKESGTEEFSSRLSQSTSNLSTVGSDRDQSFSIGRIPRPESVAEIRPHSPYFRPENVRQTSVPKEIHASSHVNYILQKEKELRAEFERLEEDRRKLVEEINEMQHRNSLRKDVLYHRSCRLPTLSEEETFRQQMHDEWRNKVAEREERRMQKIVKLTGTSNPPEVPARNLTKASSTSNIGDEFLRRVQERRSKLSMPSDSDWESGAESQPTPRPEGHKSPPKVKVIEGQSERDFKNLPAHLREFAEITNQMIEQHYQEEQVSSTERRSFSSASEGMPGVSGALKKDGIWNPNSSDALPGTRSTTRQSASSSSNKTVPPPPPPPPVWSPQPSPTPARKEFRPVKFESPVLSRKYTSQPQDSTPVTPPWTNGDSKPLYNTQSSSCSNLTSNCNFNQGQTRQQQHQNYQQQYLQKSASVGENLAARPSGAYYFETNRPHIPKDTKPPIVRPNEVLYQVKNEYMSEPETENDRPRKMAQLARRKFDGIGPTTKDGMPIVLRSEVKENNQHQWYKRMYNTLHKTKNDGRFPYKANGYMSEPEPNYDSDYSTMRYHTLDRRRIPSTGSYQEERTYGTMPNPVRSSTGSYKNQPGKIENYVPGHSSVSDKEKKEWWDEVMDIFDGHLEQQKLSSNYTEGYLSRALKEEGYESDSNVVFKKRDAPQFAPLSPIEQKQAYRNVQAGGEPPLQGFRKPAPEKPKDDEEIEYYPITPTLTKIRVHANAPKPQRPTPPIHQEIICYPITNVTRPLDMFAPFPKNVPSFIPLNPPPPPCRKSSRTNTALKIVSSHYSTSSSTGASAKPIDARHEACFRSNYYQRETPANKFGTITIKKHVKHEPIMRSKSAGTVSSSSRQSTMVREDKVNTGISHVSRKQLVRVRSVSPARFAAKSTDLRKSSPSPVAFGRSISKERMFAEERKRLEQTLPLTRKSFTASTNILKDPTIKSAEEIKKAVRSSYSTTKSQRSSASRTSSFMTTVTRKNNGLGKQEEKTLKISVSSTSKESSRKGNGRVPLPSTSKITYHASRQLEKKSPKQTTHASSTLSLARTNSTFSVDSTGSRKKESKRPLTITRSTSRDSAPQTISKRSKPKKKSPPKEVIASSKVLKRLESTRSNGGNRLKVSLQNEVSNSIAQQHDSIRSDSFFQNLFLRDRSPGNSLGDDASLQTTSVLEKAHFWNSVSARSEPSLRRSSVYLSQKKPVSDSKFLMMESKQHHKSRSLSPSYRKYSPSRRVLEQSLKFDSKYQMSEEESEFGETKPSKTEELIYKYEQRSSSEPRTRTYLTEVIRPNSPTVIHGRQTIEYSRSISPMTKEIVRPPTREVRSPSRRRIDSLRETQRAETKRIIRASSLSSADDRSRRKFYGSSELSHSTGSLNVIERHAPICRHRTSDRFKELNKFYRNLERIGQLERATSSTDLHPIRKEGELIDFDLWKQVRAHEKAEKELNHLVDKLKHDQREKDFLFRPKDVSDLKWNKRTDSGRRCKEKSVEDLRDTFERKAQGEEAEENRNVDIESSKDIYKPYWRGSSVVDAASSMVVKYNTQPKVSNRRRDDPRLFLSNTLISTLSKDQVAKIKNQLSEIYSNSPLGPSPKGKCEVKEDYVVTVEQPSQVKVGSLKVRCNSSISKEELLGPILKKKEAQIRAMQTEFTDRSFSPHRRPAQSRTFERISKEVKVNRGPELTEVEKKRLSFSISREIQDKVLERKNRNLSPSLLGRETRGAIAAENAKKSMPESTASKDIVSIDYSAQQQVQSRDSSLEHRKTVRVRKASGGESESNTSDISKATVIFKGKPVESVNKKIQYFEEKKAEEPPKTIYHAREYSSPDEEEVMKAIEEKMKAREQETRGNIKHTELSSSASDFKELFGERAPNFPVPPPPPPPDEQELSNRCTEKSQYRSSSLTLSNGSSYETLYRSRSASPAPRKLCISYLNALKSGDVRKIKNKFETLSSSPRVSFFELSPPRRIRSDPALNTHVYLEGKQNTHKVTIRDHEAGDVSWITHKFEMKNKASSRGRSRVRKVISPISRNPLRREDRLMPHIDIISKTALLKQQVIKSKSPSRTTRVEFVPPGEVERIRSKFESPDRSSLLGQMYTSSPDIRELRDISSYLNASWVAHKYPKQRDNARSPICPEQGPESVAVKRRVVPARPNSTSPPRTKDMITSILKPYYDIFADQKFDPLMHRPISRYVPIEKEQDISAKGHNGFLSHSIMEAEQIEEHDVEPPTPPPPPMKNVNLHFQNGSNYYQPESPRRYVEGDVNIHYKSPIRYEYKDTIPDEELARKQAESMKKLYQEERRRKYLQELEDMNSRRHADNFIPSQKSPISLNRYDDFPTDVIAPKSPASAPFTRTVARALYDFYGKAARELSFKKGDLIYLRRQVDKNWLEGEHNAMVGIVPINYVEILSKDGNKPAIKKKPSEGQARAKFSFQAATASELSLNKGELVTLTRRVDDNWFEGKIGGRKGIFPVSYVEVLTNIGADDNVRESAGSNNNYASNVAGKPIAAAPPASRALFSTSNISPTLDQLRASINHEFNHVTNGGQRPNGILRETKTSQKTEVLHIDTNSQPRPYRAIYKYYPQNSDELELHEGDIVHVLEQCDDGWYVGSSERTGQFGTFPGNYVEEL